MLLYIYTLPNCFSNAAFPLIPGISLAYWK